MDKYPHEAWVRVGKALERRRGQLGYGFRRRGEFAEGSGLSAKTLARIEHAWRDGYPDDTIALIESIYQWQPGSIEQVLSGGNPAPLQAQAQTPAADLIREAGWDVPERAPDLVWKIAEAPADQLSDSQKRGIIGEYARQYAPRRPRQNPGSARSA